MLDTLFLFKNPNEKKIASPIFESQVLLKMCDQKLAPQVLNYAFVSTLHLFCFCSSFLTFFSLGVLLFVFYLN